MTEKPEETPAPEGQEPKEPEAKPEGDGASELESKLAEQTKQIEELQKELSGLKNKDYNFKKFRDMTEQERESLSERERELMQRQEKLEEEQQSFMERTINAAKQNALNVLIGDDDGLRERVLANYDLINIEARTDDEIAEKMRKAVGMTTGATPVGMNNPVANAMGGYVPTGTRSKSKSDVTPEQKELAKKLGITEEELKKLA